MSISDKVTRQSCNLQIHNTLYDDDTVRKPSDELGQ